MNNTKRTRISVLLFLGLAGLLYVGAQGAGNPPAAVVLAWDPSPGTNVITNYTVWWGTNSRAYSNSVSAGTNLMLGVSNLARGGTYWFAATATDANGLSSTNSNEVFWRAPTPPAGPGNVRITLTQ